MEFQDEAIVLKSIDFRDHQKIVTLFTKSNGILSAIAKHLSPKNLRKNALCAPLTRASYILKSGRGDMVTIFDGHIIDAHLESRESYPRLMTSFEILKAISSSQLPGKVEPKVYQLLAVYLKELKRTPFPNSLLTSFILKILRHEGLLHEGLVSNHLMAFGNIHRFEEIKEETDILDLKEAQRIFSESFLHI